MRARASQPWYKCSSTYSGQSKFGGIVHLSILSRRRLLWIGYWPMTPVEIGTGNSHNIIVNEDSRQLDLAGPIPQHVTMEDANESDTCQGGRTNEYSGTWQRDREREKEGEGGSRGVPACIARYGTASASRLRHETTFS